MSTKEYKVSYSINIEAEHPQEAAEWLADFLTKPGVPQRGAYEVEDEDGAVVIVDLSDPGHLVPRTSPRAIVAIRDGGAYEGIGVEVIDLDFLNGDSRADYTAGDILSIIRKLRAAGLPSAADDVQEWWAR